MNVCALGGKERGGLLSEMKVERNKRFGFNLVVRGVLPCAQWLEASCSLRKDWVKSSVRKRRERHRSIWLRKAWCEFNRFRVEKKKKKKKDHEQLAGSTRKCVNAVFILFLSRCKVMSSLNTEHQTQIPTEPRQMPKSVRVHYAPSPKEHIGISKRCFHQ